MADRVEPAERGAGAPTPPQVDFHIHTFRSACARGNMTVDNAAAAAARAGRKAIGITDHILRREHLGLILECEEEIRIRSFRGMVVCAGCELDMVSPGVAAAKVGPDASLDYVGIAVNHFHLSTVAQPPLGDPAGIASYWATLARSIGDLPRADVWVHPAHVGQYEEALGERTLLSYLTSFERDEIFRVLREANVAVELRRLPDNPSRVESHVEFYREAKRHGVRFSVGSDSHNLETLAFAWEAVADVAREAGFEESDLWLPPRARRAIA